MKKETQCVHSGNLQDSVAGGVNSPVYPSSAFNYLEGGDIPYPRYFNTPNQKAIVPAVSLGGIETTICAPAVTSHAKMTQAERKRTGITSSLLRLSTGIEYIDDLLEDIEEALKGKKGK